MKVANEGNVSDNHQPPLTHEKVKKLRAAMLAGESVDGRDVYLVIGTLDVALTGLAGARDLYREFERLGGGRGVADFLDELLKTLVDPDEGGEDAD